MPEADVQASRTSKRMFLIVLVGLFDFIVLIIFLGSIIAADKPDKAAAGSNVRINAQTAEAGKKTENSISVIPTGVPAVPTATLANSPQITGLHNLVPVTPDTKPAHAEKVTAGEKEDTDSSKVTENLNDTDEKQSNITEWVTDKLVPGNQNIKQQREIKTWVGWLFERDCIGINPYRHTKECNMMGTCIDSGLGVVEYIQGKDYNTYKSLDCFKAFDVEGRDIAVAFLKELPDYWKTNITVKVTGYIVDNIPVNADKSVVPEFDSSKVDHFIIGIHILSIEAAYIDGLSTNKLPEPNLVYPKG